MALLLIDRDDARRTSIGGLQNGSKKIFKTSPKKKAMPRMMRPAKTPLLPARTRQRK
jgi:hypothetical protein